MYKPDPQIKKSGSKMIILGYALLFFVVTYFFNAYLENQNNPNSYKVLSKQEGSVILKANHQGMYLAEGKINNVYTDFVVDTGASVVSVPLAIAKAANLELGQKIQVKTANGITHAWDSHIKTLELGNFIFQNIDAIVLENVGDDIVLLGMNAIKNLRVQQEAGILEFSIVN